MRCVGDAGVRVGVGLIGIVTRGVGVIDGAKIVEGFCDFYCKVGPNLAARLGKEQDGAFLNYMGERV